MHERGRTTAPAAPLVADPIGGPGWTAAGHDRAGMERSARTAVGAGS
jgi:hypothetical protein